MTKEQKKWADYVISGMPELQAASKVWKGVTKKTLTNKLGKLRADEGIKSYIKEQASKITHEVNKKVSQTLIEEQVDQLLTNAKKRAILAKIVNMEIEFEKFVVVKGELKKVKSKPDMIDVMRAIEIDNKMSGDNVQSKPNQVAKAEEVTTVVVVRDETKPNGESSKDK